MPRLEVILLIFLICLLALMILGCIYFIMAMRAYMNENRLKKILTKNVRVDSSSGEGK